MKYNIYDSIEIKNLKKCICYNCEIPDDFILYLIIDNKYKNKIDYEIICKDKIKVAINNTFDYSSLYITSNYHILDNNKLIDVGINNRKTLNIYFYKENKYLLSKISLKKSLICAGEYKFIILKKTENILKVKIIRLDKDRWDFNLKLFISEFIKIPKNVYYTLPNKNLLKEINTKKTLFFQKDYNFHFYDDEDCLRFIYQNFSYDIYLYYCQLIPGAYKSDFWRLCILYIKGGIYIDLGLKVINNLDEILEYNDLILVRDRDNNGIFNAFMCCIPFHPFIKLCIEELCDRIKKFDYGKNPLSFSGPGFIYNILYKYYQNIDKNILNNIIFYHNQDGTNINSLNGKAIIETKNGDKIFKTKYNKNKICSLRKEFIDSIGNKIEAYHYDILWEKKIVFHSIYYGSWNHSAKDYYIKNGYLYSRLKNIENEWVEDKIKLEPFQNYCNKDGKFYIEN